MLLKIYTTADVSFDFYVSLVDCLRMEESVLDDTFCKWTSEALQSTGKAYAG